MSHECPTCDRDDFDSKKGLRIHHSKAHGESIRNTTTCDHCGGEFESPRNAPGKYCSRKCMGLARRNRVTLECETCGTELEVPKSEADRRFCSQDCRAEGLSKDDDLRSCEVCGRTFSVEPHKPTRLCSRACQSELKADRPRPDDIEMLLWLLYVYEGYGVVETFRRQRAVVGFDDCLKKGDVRDRLEEMGVMQEYNAARWTLQDLDPDEVGDPTPDGDDSWEELYSTG
ncbi:hypothetical protein [Natrinema sp. H-ect4]|uniref:hypothetical protein n=1 Tax=Natrinema sp. H-ect4 TaxID=3242699 RepID=UPI0035A8DF00